MLNILKITAVILKISDNVNITAVSFNMIIAMARCIVKAFYSITLVVR